MDGIDGVSLRCGSPLPPPNAMPRAERQRATKWPPERPISTSQPFARAAPTSGTNSLTTCCPPGSPTWTSASPRRSPKLSPPGPQSGIRLRRARGCAGRSVHPPHAAPLRLADRSRRRTPIGDLVQASFSSVMAFSDPGDAVLLQLPSYPPFMAAIKDTGRRLIANPMRDNGTRWVLDLAAYEAEPDPRARVLIFCHPQNPTGRAYSRAELDQVAAFAIRHDLIVVSDEIHADIVYPGNTHIPLASLSLRSPPAPSPSPRPPRASTSPRCAPP